MMSDVDVPCSYGKDTQYCIYVALSDVDVAMSDVDVAMSDVDVAMSDVIP
ncbi:MAG: hypothetical protein WCI05_01040 [Myxococcales bacterium]|jgi:hypothetical protein